MNTDTLVNILSFSVATLTALCFYCLHQWRSALRMSKDLIDIGNQVLKTNTDLHNMLREAQKSNTELLGLLRQRREQA